MGGDVYLKTENVDQVDGLRIHSIEDSGSLIRVVGIFVIKERLKAADVIEGEVQESLLVSTELLYFSKSNFSPPQLTTLKINLVCGLEARVWVMTQAPSKFFFHNDMLPSSAEVTSVEPMMFHATRQTSDGARSSSEATYSRTLDSSRFSLCIYIL